MTGSVRQNKTAANPAATKAALLDRVLPTAGGVFVILRQLISMFRRLRSGLICTGLARGTRMPWVPHAIGEIGASGPRGY